MKTKRPGKNYDSSKKVYYDERKRQSDSNKNKRKRYDEDVVNNHVTINLNEFAGTGNNPDVDNNDEYNHSSTNDVVVDE